MPPRLPTGSVGGEEAPLALGGKCDKTQQIRLNSSKLEDPLLAPTFHTSLEVKKIAGICDTFTIRVTITPSVTFSKRERKKRTDTFVSADLLAREGDG